jgi:pimeloyl-ACP methyl ester carboxylesterase
MRLEPASAKGAIMTSLPPAPDMPMPRDEIMPDGVRLRVYEAGPAHAAVTIVLAHGFPELAYSWRRQIAAFAEAGYRVIAPDQRGYGGSDCPSAIEAYDLAHLCGDLVALLDGRGIEKAVFVGHDWGGIITWHLPLRFPERVLGLVGLNTPYTKRAPQDPIALYRRRFGDAYYIVRFNDDPYAHVPFETDLDKTFRFLQRKPGPPPAGVDPRAGMDMAAALAAFDPDADNFALLSDAERAVYVASFRRTGFTPPINWYRNFTRNWQNWPDRPDHVPHPSLMITAELDAALPPSVADGMEKFVPDLERALLKGCGHWSQQEQPAEVNRLILDFIQRRFG